MNAPFVIPTNVTGLAAIEAVYAERCEARALLFIGGQISLHEAVDELQANAERSGLINSIGQDEAQRIMSVAFAAVDLLPEPDGELNEAFEREIMIGAAELVRRWELADPRDRWRHTGEAPPKAAGVLKARPEPYTPPPATVAAFWYVVSTGNRKHLAEWLAQHPADRPELFKLWKAKRC
jgi:hypothetical protein